MPIATSSTRLSRRPAPARRPRVCSSPSGAPPERTVRRSASARWRWSAPPYAPKISQPPSFSACRHRSSASARTAFGNERAREPDEVVAVRVRERGDVLFANLDPVTKTRGVDVVPRDREGGRPDVDPDDRRGRERAGERDRERADSHPDIEDRRVGRERVGETVELWRELVADQRCERGGCLAERREQVRVGHAPGGRGTAGIDRRTRRLGRASPAPPPRSGLRPRGSARPGLRPSRRPR